LRVHRVRSRRLMYFFRHVPVSSHEQILLSCERFVVLLLMSLIQLRHERVPYSVFMMNTMPMSRLKQSKSKSDPIGSVKFYSGIFSSSGLIASFFRVFPFLRIPDHAGLQYHILFFRYALHSVEHVRPIHYELFTFFEAGARIIFTVNIRY
jgi:hypothetical protein